MKKLLRSIIVTLLAAFFPVALGNTMDMIRCIGADGHIALETARNGRCGNAGVLPSLLPGTLTATRGSRTDHCGPCVDVPVLISDADDQPLVITPLTFSQLTALELPLVTGGIASSATLAPTSLLLLPLPRSASSTPLRALHTVVLLI